MNERHGSLDQSEYDSDQRHRTILAIIILVSAILIIALSIAGYFINGNRTKHTSQDIRYSQYVACAISTNDVIKQVRDEFVDVKRETLIPVFKKIKRTIPQGQTTRNILDNSVQNMKFSISTIDERIPTFPCKKLYPPLDGQVFPKVKEPK
jgi:hypothetical protein